MELNFREGHSAVLHGIDPTREGFQKHLTLQRACTLYSKKEHCNLKETAACCLDMPVRWQAGCVPLYVIEAEEITNIAKLWLISMARPLLMKMMVMKMMLTVHLLVNWWGK
jgi:hypothetical protein